MSKNCRRFPFTRKNWRENRAITCRRSLHPNCSQKVICGGHAPGGDELNFTPRITVRSNTRILVALGGCLAGFQPIQFEPAHVVCQRLKSCSTFAFTVSSILRSGGGGIGGLRRGLLCRINAEFAGWVARRKRAAALVRLLHESWQLPQRVACRIDSTSLAILALSRPHRCGILALA